MGTFITISQVLLSLCILIILHECGHFFPARWFKTRVEKFYLFFDPWFSIFKVQKGDTEYGIGWLPLGGYVKISGMIDESMDKDQMQGPVQPWEFRAKPAWQRLIIMLGGVTVNFVLGFLIFAFLLWNWGTTYIPVQNVKNGIAVTELGHEIGLRDGDDILAIGDIPFTKFSEGLLIKEVVINSADAIKIRRNGTEHVVSIDKKYIKELAKQGGSGPKLFNERMPATINEIAEESAAAKSGLMAGDRIIAVADNPVTYNHEFVKLRDLNRGQSQMITVVRGSETLKLSADFPKEGSFGFDVVSADVAVEKYSLARAIPKGISMGVNFLGDQVKAFGQMFKGNIDHKDSLGSIITIGKQFGTDWDWYRFWRMTGMLSLILAFLNLLPIPALDGGYVMFLLWEVITGIKPSDKVMEYTTMAGFFLLMGLMVYVLGLDIVRNFF